MPSAEQVGAVRGRMGWREGARRIAEAWPRASSTTRKQLPPLRRPMSTAESTHKQTTTHWGAISSKADNLRENI